MRGLRWAVLGVLAAPVVACGTEVSVGSAAPMIDLSHCQGTDCSVVAARAELAAYPPSSTCDAGPSQAVESAFEVHLRPLPPACDPERPEFDADVCWNGGPGSEPIPTTCPVIGSCVLGIGTLAGAPDGSVFALVGGTGWEDGQPLQNRNALWLRHYAEDGTRLGEALIFADLPEPDGQIFYHTSNLSVDARGHAFVVVSSEHSPVRASVATTELPVYHSSLLEFDAGAKPVGAPIAFAPRVQPRGLATLLSAAGDGIVLAEQAFGGGALAFFDPWRRALRWVHDRRGKLAIATVTADSEGEVTLSTRFPTGMFSGRLEHYAADGTLSWERELVQMPEDLSLDGDPVLAATMDRSLVMLQPRLDPPTNDVQADGSFVIGNVTSLSAIGAGGDPLFQTSISAPVSIDAEESEAGWTSGTGSVGLVATSGGAIAFLANEYRLFGRPPVAVIGVVSGDGRRCARYDWSQSVQSAPLLAAAGNNIYVTTYSGLARLRLPAELLP